MSVTMSIRTTKGSILRPGWKSALDITCILLSLPVWLPLMILLMLVTRIASPGPIFYRQERIGFGGRHFFICKFRTMKLSAETQVHERHFEELMRVDCPMTKLDVYGDPRLAPFGRILRASGLDELPQIFNVLRGEMSLVGPRPCTPNEFAHYEPWQRERVNGLPGLTGYWQVNGKNKTTFNEMIAMDLFYLENVSILLDLKIMLKTGAVIAGQLFESQPAAHTHTQSRQSGNRRSPTTTIFKFPSVLLLPVSTAAAQFQSWLLETASSVWYLVRSLCSRAEHAVVALVTLLLGLCQQGKVTQQAGWLAEQAGELAEKAVATSLVATSFVAPTLAETTDFDFDLGDASPPPRATPNIRKGKVASRAIVKRGPRRARPQYEIGPALRFEKTIDHQWRRLVAARKNVHSAFARLIRDAHSQQSKQKHRKQRRS
jgi:lipopolysaccharide/colanic/teichoic acid biosynthesis glycosyltransferase